MPAFAGRTLSGSNLLHSGFGPILGSGGHSPITRFLPVVSVPQEFVSGYYAYKDFLTLWKDADADVSILKEAKAEYAKLQ